MIFRKTNIKKKMISFTKYYLNTIINQCHPIWSTTKTSYDILIGGNSIFKGGLIPLEKIILTL
jgi:hypothetical protein